MEVVLAWVPRTELQSPGFHGNGLYLMSHLTCLILPLSITDEVETGSGRGSLIQKEHTQR